MKVFKKGDTVELRSKHFPEYNGVHVVHEARRHGDYCEAPEGQCGIGNDTYGYDLGFSIRGKASRLWDETVVHEYKPN